MAVKGRYSERRAPLRHGNSISGFTLAEVLVAATIFALGLLALQALGVAAVHATASAGRDSGIVSTGVHQMEEAYGELVDGRLPPVLSCTLPTGDRVSRVVAVLTPGTLARVEVEVVPAAHSTAPVPFVLVAHVYSPTGFAPLPAPAPCL